MLQNKLMHRTGLTTGLAASWLMVLAVTLQGCAPQGGGMAAASTSADDVCRSQRLALDDSQQFFAGDIVKGALIGAAGGALGGFLLGGNGQSAAIGALAGTAAGGFAGYWTSLQNQGGSHSDVISRMVGDMDREQQQVDKAQAAFNALIECRKASARRINADLRAGTITRDQATAQMAGVRALADQDVQLARRINARLDERTNNYVYATEQATGTPLQTSAAPTPGTRAERARTGGQARTDPAGGGPLGRQRGAPERLVLGAEEAELRAIDPDRPGVDVVGNDDQLSGTDRCAPSCR